jgi:hypothetical protein
MAFQQVEIQFSGSFQCRLATESDATNESRSDPYGDIRPPASIGWTFDYNENRFDRIIRCQNPVQLRSLLVDPFDPVVVRQIQVKPEPIFGFDPPWQPLFGDPLLNVPVSLGPQAMFDTAAGGSAAHEAIVNCQLSFGTMLTAVPTSLPKLKGIERRPEWTSEYLLKKPALVAAAVTTGSISSTRLKVLTEMNPIQPSLPIRLENYAAFFGMREEITPVPASIDFSPAGAQGLLAQLLLDWTWQLQLAFSRFDGDTLTGRLDGKLAGFHSNF